MSFLAFSLKSTESTSIRAGKMVRYNKTIDTGSNRREITGDLYGCMLTVMVWDGEKAEGKRFSTMSFEATNMQHGRLAA